MTKKSTRAIGDEGEDLAVLFLEAKGFVIIERNYTFERSEIDIVARDKEMIVFIEVKLRRNIQFGHPEEFVDEKKIKHIHHAVNGWLYERQIENTPIRFDVIAIVRPSGKEPEIKHLKDAFR